MALMKVKLCDSKQKELALTRGTGRVDGTKYYFFVFLVIYR